MWILAGLSHQDNHGQFSANNKNFYILTEIFSSGCRSLDGVTGGDEYELTGDDTEYYSDPVTKQTKQVDINSILQRPHNLL